MRDPTGPEHEVHDPGVANPEEAIVTSSVPDDPALRGGESEANKEPGGEFVGGPKKTPSPEMSKLSGKYDGVNTRLNRLVTSKGVTMTQLTVKKGIQKHGKMAVDLIVKEFIQLFDIKKALKPIRPRDVKAMKVKERVRSSMFIKEKYNSNNNFEKLKGRLVSDGSTQDKALYPDLSSPTARLESIFIALELAMRKRIKRCKMDIDGAYLNAYIYRSKGDDVIIMIIPRHLTKILVKKLPELKAFVDPKSGTLWTQVLKAMYSLVQSASLWYEALVKFLLSLGFKVNPLDRCVLVRRDKTSYTIIILYVDDILVLTNQEKIIGWVHKRLEDEYETVEADTLDSFTYLGMVMSTEPNGMLSVSMQGYTANVVQDYEVLYKVKEVTTPATLDLFVVGDGNNTLGPKESKVFHTFVAKLLYLCKRSCINIQLAVLFCARALKL